MNQKAPIDPRSMMQGDYIQGDYMRLVYDVGQNHSNLPKKKRGYLVLGLEENKVATFKRFYEDEPLAPDEKLIHYHIQYNSIRIVPDSFMLQEGQGKFYEDAKYAVFKFEGPRNSILTALADDKLQIIMPGVQ